MVGKSVISYGFCEKTLIWHPYDDVYKQTFHFSRGVVFYVRMYAPSRCQPHGAGSTGAGAAGRRSTCATRRATTDGSRPRLQSFRAHGAESIDHSGRITCAHMKPSKTPATIRTLPCSMQSLSVHFSLSHTTGHNMLSSLWLAEKRYESPRCHHSQ